MRFLRAEKSLNGVFSMSLGFNDSSSSHLILRCDILCQYHRVTISFCGINVLQVCGIFSFRLYLSDFLLNDSTHFIVFSLKKKLFLRAVKNLMFTVFKVLFGVNLSVPPQMRIWASSCIHPRSL